MTTEEKFEESKLVQLLAADSEYALQLLYDRHRNRIYKLSTRFLKSPLSAQEVVQDVFLKLWMMRKEIKVDKPLEAWLFTVAKNAILNRFKKMAVEWNQLSTRTSGGQMAVDKSDSKLLTAELSFHIDQAVKHLPAKQKEVYELAKVEGYSYSQIAEIMQISPLTVKTHLTRAMESIRSSLTAAGCDG